MSWNRLASGPFQDLHVSASTIQRAMAGRGYKRYTAIRQHILSQPNKDKRLKFAHEHITWTYDDWSKVLFSDETWVTAENHRKVHVTRRADELFSPTCVRSRVQRRPGWMFWGAFHGDTRGPYLTWVKEWGSICGSSYQVSTPFLYQLSFQHHTDI